MFHDYVLSWWQAGLLKIALLAAGLIIGSTWSKFFKKKPVWTLLWILFVASLLYLVIALWPQFWL